MAYNKHEEPLNTHQWGGTGIILTNELTPRSTNDTEVDTLGRWTSILLNGKGTMKTLVVSVYGPHQHRGELLAILQHRTYYLNKNQLDHPHYRFWEELEPDIKNGKIMESNS